MRYACHEVTAARARRFLSLSSPSMEDGRTFFLRV
jgi:hypothetical protein